MQRFIALIVGIIFLGVGIFMYIRNDNLIKNCTEETIATVVDIKQELSSDTDSATSYMYYPIIEYKVGENTLKVTMDSGSNTPEYNINEKITILYNPNKTKEFIVKGDKTGNIFSIIFMTLGLFATGYGIKMALSKN